VSHSHSDCSIDNTEIENSLNYIRNHPEINDVLVSGGDPLMLDDDKLDYILKQIREISHVKFIRIGSRLPVQLPSRVTPKLCKVIEENNVNLINMHINHPKEITPVFCEKIKMLRKTGVMLGCQTVLLKGVNDDSEILKTLFMELISNGIRPYYLYSCDPTQGNDHFIVPLERMIELYQQIRGWISGPAIPTFVIDGIDGIGKLPVLPQYVTIDENRNIIGCNYRGEKRIMNHLK
jgi:lysine 2,3-aminomutase